MATVCWHFKSLHPDEVWSMPLRELRTYLDVIAEVNRSG